MANRGICLANAMRKSNRYRKPFISATCRLRSSTSWSGTWDEADPFGMMPLVSTHHCEVSEMNHIRNGISILIAACMFSAEAACESKNPAYVADVLTHGIDLNETFKQSVKSGDQANYLALRKQVEHNDEEVVMPCVRRAAQILSKRSDPALMHKFMGLIISYENSADETISHSIGEVFAADPQAIESGIKKFSRTERQAIIDSILMGWTNVKPGLNAALIIDREKRIKHLTP
jgi:hypothetical protein